jgi:hypothetical protein
LAACGGAAEPAAEEVVEVRTPRFGASISGIWLCPYCKRSWF